jgi:hypothetical protein
MSFKNLIFNKLKYYWLALLILFAVIPLLPIVCNGNYKVEQVSCWKEPPLVAICSESKFSKDDVYSVIKKWEGRGYHFLDVIDQYSCEHEHIEGVILITGIGQFIEDNDAGHSNTEYTIYGITSSIIEIRDYDLLVLEHEIGHSLGYQHVYRFGHLMYDNKYGAGLNDFGLYAKDSKCLGEIND